MAFRLVSSGGATVDPAVVNMYASGVVRPGMVVAFSLTGGAGVYPVAATATQSLVFGVCLDYAQGASDVQVKVIPFNPSQIWEADCTDAAITAQIGLLHKVNTTGTEVRNTSTSGTGIESYFRAIAMVGATTGSGKLLGQIMRPAYY
jgi:hypothetical protein